jgi:purine-nucleoside/S-methyl-5'-thioadenosine phosphorylase / adenosine deaminase
VEPLTVLPADLGPGVRAAFTTRAGGVSVGSYAGLDLALHVGDDRGAVHENRALLAAWAGAPVRFARQVHGTTVRVLAEGEAGLDDCGAEPEADGLVTSRAGVPLGVLVADCLPVLLADVDAGVAAVAHAGRRGLLAGVLPRVVEAMAALGARPESTRASVGPAAGGCCYEVPAEMLQKAVAVLPELGATTTWGTPSLDLRAGAVAQLRALGLGAVTTVGGCTIEDESFYSYRRSRRTGRFAGVVVLAP